MRSAFAKALKHRGSPQILTMVKASGVFVGNYRCVMWQLRSSLLLPFPNIFFCTVVCYHLLCISLITSCLKQTTVFKIQVLRRRPSGLSWRVSRSWREVRLVGVDILVGLDVRSRSAVAVIESRVGAEKEPIASKMACGGLWD
jgi:hypothetical protein